jgi:hypothetical protein
VNIESGKANVVAITVQSIPPVWDGTLVISSGNSDFAFSVGNGLSTITAGAPDRFITLGSDTVLPVTGSTFSVAFNLLKLQPLIDAEHSKLTLQGYNVRLLPRNAAYSFSTVNLTLPTASWLDTSVPGLYTITVGNGGGTETETLSFTNVTPTQELPQKNVDGLLDFELTYRAFGSGESAGTTAWIIRNGLNRTEDGGAGTLGGRFVVKIGTGTILPDPDVTVYTP